MDDKTLTEISRYVGLVGMAVAAIQQIVEALDKKPIGMSTDEMDAQIDKTAKDFEAARARIWGRLGIEPPGSA